MIVVAPPASEMRLAWNSGPIRPSSALRADPPGGDERGQADHREEVAPGAPERPELQELAGEQGRHAPRSPGSPVSSRKTSSSVARSVVSSCSTTPFAAADLPNPLGRCRHDHGAVAEPARVAAEQGRPAGRPPASGSACPRRAGEHLVHRPLQHEPAVRDDHDLVDGLRDLGEHMAGDEDGAALRRERPDQVAQPADALRVEPVRRLVEDERLRIAEERGGDPEALPHAERVATRTTLRGTRQLDD